MYNDDAQVQSNAPAGEQVQGNKLYVGNLPYSATNDALTQLFGEAGTVTDAVVILDRVSGRSKGFGFVTMATDEEADKAIEMFHQYEMDGRPLVVNKARPKEERPRGSFGGGRGGFGGGRSGGYNNRGGDRGGYGRSDRGGYRNND
jgi:RNA recognition motif-containing protein